MPFDLSLSFVLSEHLLTFSRSNVVKVLVFLACPTLEEQSPSLQGGGECLEAGVQALALTLDSQEFSPGSGSPPAPPDHSILLAFLR